MYLNHMAGGENLHSTEGVHLPTIAKLCSAKPIPGNEGKRAGVTTVSVSISVSVSAYS